METETSPNDKFLNLPISQMRGLTLVTILLHLMVLVFVAHIMLPMGIIQGLMLREIFVGYRWSLDSFTILTLLGLAGQIFLLVSLLPIPRIKPWLIIGGCLLLISTAYIVLKEADTSENLIISACSCLPYLVVSGTLLVKQIAASR